LRLEHPVRPERPPFNLLDLYPFAGLILAIAFGAAGAALLLLRVGGQTSWQTSAFFGVRFDIQTGAPGVFFILLVPVIIFLTRRVPGKASRNSSHELGLQVRSDGGLRRGFSGGSRRIRGR
jgi:hypothetical protein